MKAYLGGPIFNVSRKDAVTWRAKARKALEKIGIEINDPNERPYIPGKEEEIVTQDLTEIKEVDFLIAHTPEDTVMTGTPMEIFYASYVLKKPVFSFPKHSSPWIMYWSTETFNTLEEVVYHIEKNVINGSTELLSPTS